MKNPKIGLAWGFGNLLTMEHKPNRELTFNYIKSIVDLEVDLIETADSYLSGETEKFLGSMSRELSHISLATKVGGYRNSFPYPLNVQIVNSRVLQKVNIIRNNGYFSFNPKIHPDSLRRRLEKSLKRLKRSEIDIYMLHGVPRHCNVEDFVAELVNLKHLGMVKYIGLSLEGMQEIDTKWCDYLEVTLKEYMANQLQHRPCILRAIHRDDEKKSNQVRKLKQENFNGFIMSGTHNLNHFKELAEAVDKYR